jgi:nucleoside-diphosphate-sugar epimerase
MIDHIRVLTPNKARFAYDILVSFISTFIFILILIYFLKIQFSFYVILVPILFLVSNFFLGLYGKYKASSISRKFFILLVSSSISSFLLILLFRNFSFLLIWLPIFLPSILLPRYLLNLTNKKNFVSRVLRQRGSILIIGGAGYIGSHLVSVLLDSGENVLVLDRLMYGSDPIKKYLNNPKFKFINGDATDISLLTQAMQGVSSVVHLAGLVGDPACAVDEAFTRHTNIVATRMVKDVAQSMGIHRFIFASSCSVYGVSEFEIDETGDLNPVSLYAKSKIDSEEELRKFVADDFIVTILRFATVFGDSPRARFDLVANLFTAQSMAGENLNVIGPSQWRPFIHVYDLARAIALVLKADPRKIQNQIFNVGDERLNMTILELANIVKKVATSFGKNPEIKIKEMEISDRRNYAVCFKKIKSTLGFNASILMEDGIMEMAKKLFNNEYDDYKSDKYSNVMVTEFEKLNFYDPLSRLNLYGPLSK